MARSRNIKPGFFTNDDLAECGPLGMLLFSGLWTIADREGRLEDRPKRIKAQVLPYFDADVDELLGELAERGFIERYEVAGTRYLQITKFLAHQNPHIKEAPSTIPAPDTNPESTESAPEDDVPVRVVTLEKRDEQGTSDEHCAGTVLSRLIPDSSPLIPDTGFPDTPKPPRRGGVRVQYPPEFEEFWAEVVRKEPSKPKALDCWRRATHKASAEEILAGLRRWIPVWEVTESHLVPHITTWLNQERWTVEQPTMPNTRRRETSFHEVGQKLMAMKEQGNGHAEDASVRGTGKRWGPWGYLDEDPLPLLDEVAGDGGAQSGADDPQLGRGAQGPIEARYRVGS